jgi:hypothetical protein
VGAGTAEIHAVGEGQTVHALEQRGQVEAALQLDDDGRLAASRADHVAAADLALDVVPLAFEEGLDRG